MSEEEKKAIKVVNNRTERLIKELKIEEEDLIDEPKIAYLITQIEANKTLVNLIEKQSKEIEELKEKTKKCEYYEMVADELSKEIEYLKSQIPIDKIFYYSYKDFIPKDKIKAKVEEIKNDCKKCRFRGFCKDLLKSNQCSQGEAIKVLNKLLEE